MQQKIIFFIFFSCQIFFLNKVSGQVAGKESTFNSQAVGNRQSFYMQELGANAAVYTGNAYKGEQFTEGHAFFKENGWSQGAVIYGGIYYEDFPLLYDLVKDEIIILYYDGSSKVSLYPDDVVQFSLLGHTFIRLKESGAKGKDIKAGFYDLLYKGETEVLVKRTKTVREDISSGTFKRFPQENNRIYVRKENAYYEIKSKASLLRVFKGKKKEIRKFLKESSIRFFEDKELAAVEVARHYDKLAKGL